MVKKLRIQLFNKEGLPINDRLVDQKTEFYQGPKDKHDGPLRIEFSLENQDDVNGCIEYLRKLSGDLPIEQKSTQGRGRPSLQKQFIPDNSREVMLKEALDNAKNQDEFINMLRKEHDFVFIDSDRLQMLIPEAYSIKQRHLDKYQWLVRLTKQAKDPRNDKFDLALLIGLTILPESERDEKFVVYMNGEFTSNHKLELPKNAMTFKQTNLIKYPHYMIYDEREKWGIEHRLLLQNPERKPSKFYERWAKDIQVGDELKLKSNVKKDK